MSRLSPNDEIHWMQRADEFLTERSFPPVDRQDRERYEVRYFQQLDIATAMKSGFESVHRETLLKWGTKRFGEPTAGILGRFNSITDLNRLDELIDRTLECDSWESWLAPVAPPVPVWPMILEKLSRICRLSPNIRVGQMLAHLGFLSEDFGGQSLGVVEDESLLAVAERHLADLTACGSTTQPAMPPETDKAVAARPTMPMLNS